MAKEFKITERQWNNLHAKYNQILFTLRELEKQIPQKEKRWLTFDECIPPASVCKEVMSMMNGLRTYTGFLGRLAVYYGCEAMGLYVDTTINPKFTAEYRPTIGDAFTRTTTVSHATVLHEWFHHMVHQKVVIIDKRNSEKLADKYAEIFLQRVNS